MARPIKATNKNIHVYESFFLAVSKYNYTLYEKRILYRLVEFAQSDLNKALRGEPIKKHMRPLYRIDLLDGDKEFGMYISDILVEESIQNNYKRVKDAFKSLQAKSIEFDDGDIYGCDPFVYKPRMQKSTGVVSFKVPKSFWCAILDMTKGFRKFELLTAMKMKSPYSMRFYEIVSGQTNKIPLSIDRLREMFCLEDKYSQPASIIKRIIEPSKEELDKTAPYSFTFEIERCGNKKKSPIVGVTLFPYRIDDNQDKELQIIERQSKLTARNLFADSNIYQILRYDLGFDPQAIAKHKRLFDEGKHIIPDFESFLRQFANKNPDNIIGYVIGSVRKKIKEIKEKKEKESISPIRHIDSSRSATAIQKEDVNYDDMVTW